MKYISINDMAGIRVGSSENVAAGTGCTVVICPEGAPCGLDVRGGGPASRESELLKPTAGAAKIHAVTLCGGSAFGLDAAGGVMRYLEEHDIGYDTRVCKVPLVCASSIYDVGCGSKDIRPDAAMGYAACVASETSQVAEGNHGVGIGATVGKYAGPDYMMKSGLGICAAAEGDLQVAAIVVVNAYGDVCDADGTIIAGMLNKEKTDFACTAATMLADYGNAEDLFVSREVVTNTTLAVIITNAAFDKTAMNKIAALASNGIVRAITPVNTMADGDSVYAMSVGNVPADINVVGVFAATLLEEAVRRAVRKAESAYGIIASQDLSWLRK